MVGRNLIVGDCPVPLEPLVGPGEENAASSAALPNLARETRVDRRHGPLVVPTVAPPLRLQMSVPATRGYSEFRDQQRKVGVMSLEVDQIPEIIGRPFRRPGSGVVGIVIEEVGVIRI